MLFAFRYAAFDALFRRMPWFTPIFYAAARHDGMLTDAAHAYAASR